MPSQLECDVSLVTSLKMLLENHQLRQRRHQLNHHQIQVPLQPCRYRILRHHSIRRPPLNPFLPLRPAPLQPCRYRILRRHSIRRPPLNPFLPLRPALLQPCRYRILRRHSIRRPLLNPFLSLRPALLRYCFRLDLQNSSFSQYL